MTQTLAAADRGELPRFEPSASDRGELPRFEPSDVDLLASQAEGSLAGHLGPPRVTSAQGGAGASRPALVVAALLLLLTCGVAVFAHPAVSTFELQRGERRAPAGVRVDNQPLAGSNDTLGRFGFVIVVAGSLAGVAGLSRWSARASGAPRSQRAFLPAGYVVGLFAAFAITWWFNSQLLLYSFSPGSFGYVEWLNQATSLALSRGLSNVWTPYPQGTQDLLAALQLGATALGAWLGSDIWTPYTLFRALFQVVYLLVPSIATVYLVYRLGLRISPAHATLAATAIGFSFAPVYYGITSTVATEPLPVALAVLAVGAVLARRPTAAGLALGLGGALKLFPILLLPALLIAARNRAERLRLGLAAAAALVIVLLPSALANLDVFMSPLRWQTSRPAWETWYAMANWLVGAPHIFTAPQFEDIAVGHAFGWVFWGITPPITALLSPVPAAPLRWENLLSLVGTLLTLALCLGARSRTPRSVVRWAGFAFAGVLFWSTGWSPQYELYLVPFVLLAFPDPKVGVVAALGLEVVTALEYPLLLPWAYYYGGSAVWLTWGAVVARYVLLAWFCVYVVKHEANGGLLRRRLLWGRFSQTR